MCVCVPILICKKKKKKKKKKRSHLEHQHDQFWWCEQGNWHVIMKECYDEHFSLHTRCTENKTLQSNSYDIMIDWWWLKCTTLCQKSLVNGVRKDTREALNTWVCILIWLMATEDFVFTSCFKSHKWHILWGKSRLLSNTFFYSHHIKRSHAENIQAIKATIHTNYLRMGGVPDEEIHWHTDECIF